MRRRCRANVSARPCNEDIEHEASTDVAKHEAFVFDERGKRRSQRFPGGWRRIQQSSTAHVRGQDLALQRAPVFDAAGAGSPFGRYDGTEIESGSRPGAQLRKRGCLRISAGSVDKAVRIQNELARASDGHASIDA